MKFNIGDIRVTNGGEVYKIITIDGSSVKTGGITVEFVESGILRVTDSKSIYNNSLRSKKRTVVKVGDKFNRLTIVSRISDLGEQNTQWECLCECGNKSDVTTIALTSGHSKSCGCFKNEVAGKYTTTHGKTGTKEYGVWAAMKQRCYDPNKDNYYRYGGRGISVCDEWKYDFSQFYKDMGNCEKGMTLERKNCNGNYCKENCEWASRSVQAFNTNLRSNNVTGRTGTYTSKNGNWTAVIGVNNKLVHLGTFYTYESAVAAREAAEMQYYGFIKG
jgi:hypothetical protein